MPTVVMATVEVAVATELLEKVRSWDLGAVVDYTGAKHPDWSDARRVQAELGYREFLFLRGMYGGTDGVRLVPHVDVDEVWHSHLLHTENYMQMCAEVLGAFMHHRPSPHGKPTKRDREDYNDTCERLRHHFGDARDPRTWLGHAKAA
ncbi:MAG: glycine-rich domain-containing protein-like [Alphaproteobacteria bacterium]|nr:MAG: glycine-rich domain-containing protein-like [Alphaproteobacteria bacterium]